MKKFTLIITVILTIQSIALSQSCLPEGITFTTQDEIDNFQTNYPGCTEIEGGVKIGDWESYDITNLEGLNVITSIDGYLFIGSYGDHTMLSSLSGLDNLSFVGGEFRIMNNDSLKTLSGLNNLSTISGDLKIQSNSSLTHITGFNNLISTGGSFDIGPNVFLSSISGFGNLSTIGGDLSVGENDILPDLEWLSAINTVNSDILIIYNYEITSLAGLENINPDSFTDLYIYGNDLLSQCDIDNICEYIATTNGYIEIEANAPGCNNQQQVEEDCNEAGILDINNKIDISIYPNPTNNEIFIESKKSIKISEVYIYNQIGQMVLQKGGLNSTIDISTLPSGMYVIEVVTAESYIREKLIIQ